MMCKVRQTFVSIEYLVMKLMTREQTGWFLVEVPFTDSSMLVGFLLKYPSLIQVC